MYQTLFSLTSDLKTVFTREMQKQRSSSSESESSIFLPETVDSYTPTSPCSSANQVQENNINNATENHRQHRLYLARLTLEYQQLVDRYELCLNHLQDAAREVKILHQENANLRLANNDLTERLTVLSSLIEKNHQGGYQLSSASLPSLSIINDFRGLCIGDNTTGAREVSRSTTSPTSVIDQYNPGFEIEKKTVALPKSISIRSSGYLKMNQSAAGGTSSRVNLPSNPPRLVSNEMVRVPVPGIEGKKDEGALELDVCNQGMFKTELCNKWEETGACPYGNHCQFAHGIAELRPVIRHPRYKTEVCRMVLSGVTCPYGHRCHFRHVLTEQERFMGHQA